MKAFYFLIQIFTFKYPKRIISTCTLKMGVSVLNLFWQSNILLMYYTFQYYMETVLAKQYKRIISIWFLNVSDIWFKQYFIQKYLHVIIYIQLCKWLNSVKDWDRSKAYFICCFNQLSLPAIDLLHTRCKKCVIWMALMT